MRCIANEPAILTDDAAPLKNTHPAADIRWLISCKSPKKFTMRYDAENRKIYPLFWFFGIAGASLARTNDWYQRLGAEIWAEV